MLCKNLNCRRVSYSDILLVFKVVGSTWPHISRAVGSNLVPSSVCVESVCAFHVVWVS